jgi:tRNA G10  N-methylase Trm11
MSTLLRKVHKPVTARVSASDCASVDTSLLYDELVLRYRESNAAVEVDFRSLVHWLRLGDQLTHQLHPYPAKLLPHIAHFFSRASHLVRPGSIVLDPFCGSGTVALEASMAGHRPYVADANPLALLLTKVKTTAYNVDSLMKTKKEVIRRAKLYRTAPQIDVVNSHIWYPAKTKEGLEILLRSVLSITDAGELDFFRICFSSTARKLSYADPAISVPVRLKIGPRHSDQANKAIRSRLRWLKTAPVFDEFERVCDSNIERVRSANAQLASRKAAIYVGDNARDLSAQNSHCSGVQGGSVPLVITSPPYGSAQKYVRASSLSLNWLELAEPRSLAELESQSIGREHVSRSKDLQLKDDLPAEFNEMLRRVSEKNPKRERITELYLHELRDAATEIARVVMPGGRAVIVIGNNQVCGETLRNDRYLVEVMRNSGMEVELSLIDTIKSRGLMTKRNKTASVISRESVLVFRK